MHRRAFTGFQLVKIELALSEAEGVAPKSAGAETKSLFQGVNRCWLNPAKMHSCDLHWRRGNSVVGYRGLDEQGQVGRSGIHVV